MFAPIEFDETRDVWLGIDPGYASAYAVVCCQFVRVGDIEQCRVFDEIFVRNTVVEDVIRMLKVRSWYPKANITAISDRAGKAHPADRSQKDVWLDKNRDQFTLSKTERSARTDSLFEVFFHSGPDY